MKAFAVEDPAQLTDVPEFFSNILVAIIPLIGIISFIMVIVGGFTFLFSGGNPENIKKGQKTITFAIMGLALAILAWLILYTIEQVTGVKVTEFTFSFDSD